MYATLRRVVTGTDPNGRGRFASDAQVPAIRTPNSHPDAAFWPIWGLNKPIELPVDGDSHDYDSVFPPPGGLRVHVSRIPPEKEEKEYATASGGQQQHKTASVDVLVVLEGELWLELDGGEERLVRAGEVVIQNGTKHAWHNRSDVACTALAVMYGAEHKDSPDWLKM